MEKLKQEKHSSVKIKASLFIVISGLISKVLAALYRIPYQNLVGDRGFYAYQQLYPILAIISTLGLVGLPNLVSSLYHSRKKISLASFFFVEILFSVLASLLFFGMGPFLAKLMEAPSLALALQLIGINWLFLPFISFYRGLAQAQQEMRLTAVSQVLEQFVRVCMIILSAIFYLTKGLDIYQTATLASLGNSLASLVVLGYLLAVSPYKLRDYFGQWNWDWSFLGTLGLESFNFLLFSIYLLLFQLVDAFSVKSALENSGLSALDAETAKGIYDRGQPLIQFGLVFATALFTSQLPHLTKTYQKDKKRYVKESQSFYDVIVYLSLTLTCGFLSLLTPINQVLFEDHLGDKALAIYTSLIFWTSLLQFFHQKYFIEGRSRQAIWYLVMGLALKIGLTYPLTYLLGPVGASLATILPFIILLVLFLKKAELSQDWRYNYKFWLGLVMMVLVVKMSNQLLPSENRLGLLLNVMISGLGGASFFLYYCKAWQVFEEDLWAFLPISKKK